MSHPKCHPEDGHVCARPSGRTCVEPGCGKPAGTLWGPMWCPECDEKRLDHVSGQLDAIVAGFANQDVTP